MQTPSGSNIWVTLPSPLLLLVRFLAPMTMFAACPLVMVERLKRRMRQLLVSATTRVLPDEQTASGEPMPAALKAETAAVKPLWPRTKLAAVPLEVGMGV